MLGRNRARSQRPKRSRRSIRNISGFSLATVLHVMAGLVPAIHVFGNKERRGCPAQGGHDENEGNAMLLEGFKRSEIKTSGARIVTVIGGSGPPLLLMHGNPFTHLSWLKVAPSLAHEFTVVATDLRGYGDSEKPPGGEDHSGYSFRAMAQDQVEVMASLGFDKFYAAGHDRGGRVLHRMCLDHPKKVGAGGDPRHHPAASPVQQHQQSNGQRSPGIGSSTYSPTTCRSG